MSTELFEEIKPNNSKVGVDGRFSIQKAYIHTRRTRNVVRKFYCEANKALCINKKLSKLDLSDDVVLFTPELMNNHRITT